MDAEYREPSSAAVPMSYAILSLPPKSEMRKKGYSPDDVNFNGGLATHPLAKWQVYSLQRGCTYKEAVMAIQKANDKPWGLVKARLNFSDGSYEQFERKDVHSMQSFRNTETYHPNGVYLDETKELSAKRRAEQLPRLRPLVDKRGHHLSSKPIPRTFAPEVLYKNCPPPVHSQAGYDFTPISHNAFLIHPKDDPPGVRHVRSNFMHESVDYRPHSYLRTGPRDSRHCHCNEVFQVGDYTMDFAQQGETVNQRNHLVTKEFSPIGTLKSNSTIVGRRHAREPRFACSSKKMGTAVGGAADTSAVGRTTDDNTGAPMAVPVE